MAQSSTMTTKGQITVPPDVRKRMGLRPGDKVEFVFEYDQTILRPARSEENPFTKWIGIAPGFGSMEDIHAWVAEMRDDEDEPR